MEPEIIFQMRNLSLQAKEKPTNQNEPHVNNTHSQKTVLDNSVLGTNELIVHLKRLSFEPESVRIHSETHATNKNQKTKNVQHFEKNEIQLYSLPIEKKPQLFANDSLTLNNVALMNWGHFKQETLESNNYYNDTMSPGISNQSDSSAISFGVLQSLTNSKLHHLDYKHVDWKSLAFLRKKAQFKQFMEIDDFTPKSHDSWTSSEDSNLSLVPSKEYSINNINHFMPWKNLIENGNKGNNASNNNIARIHRNINVLKTRQGKKLDCKVKFYGKVKSNVKWPSNDSFTCLLCDKPGHFCHKCKFYNSKTFQCNTLASDKILGVMNIVDYNIKSSNQTLDENIG